MGEVVICAYVDDMLIVGDEMAVDKTHEELRKSFKIVVEEATEFLGCKWIESEKGYVIHQPHILMKLESSFLEEVKEMKEYATPSGESYRVNRVQENEPYLSPTQQTRYRSGIGIALYLSRFSRPDICNATRELSKGMIKANEAHYKQLLRLIKYIIDTKQLMLKIELKEGDWNMTGFCDSDFAGDNDTRKSISGYIIYLNGMIVSYRSKGQNIVTLSSTEAEYVAATDMIIDILFIKHIMDFLEVKLTLPIMVNIDNKGATFLANNEYASQRTKHIDVKYHFIRQHIEEGTIKTNLIKSEENPSDVFTKNLGHNLFWKHVNNMMEWNKNQNWKIKQDVKKKTFEIKVGCQNEFISIIKYLKLRKNEKKIKNIHKKMMK